MKRSVGVAILVVTCGPLLACGDVELPPVSQQGAMDALFTPPIVATPDSSTAVREEMQQEGALTAELERWHRILDSARDTNLLHDTCVAFVYGAGDESSVPHLIRALKAFPDHEPGPGEGVVCTQAHCADALKRITGAKAGYSYSSWRHWYDTNRGRPTTR